MKRFAYLFLMTLLVVDSAHAMGYIRLTDTMSDDTKNYEIKNISFMVRSREVLVQIMIKSRSIIGCTLAFDKRDIEMASTIFHALDRDYRSKKTHVECKGPNMSSEHGGKLIYDYRNGFGSKTYFEIDRE